MCILYSCILSIILQVESDASVTVSAEGNVATGSTHEQEALSEIVCLFFNFIYFFL